MIFDQVSDAEASFLHTGFIHDGWSNDSIWNSTDLPGRIIGRCKSARESCGRMLFHRKM